ncbi:Hypothetical predicted protein [Olea europaea subsp. europaea]|uniref:Uncharacterized protein n=1 Tax=Olea europaea subsp. europaea TaxID=158383 RepID=A0A8S0SYC2_OLEEU|nr:Hypothetical predicted protein [Olea europaea subsp. europaea]
MLAPSTSYVRKGESAGVSLTRAKVEKMLLDQRTLVEIRLHAVKLEIMQHVTHEFVKLREFNSTLIPPSGSSTTAPAGEAEIEPRFLGRGSMHSEPGLNDDNDEVYSNGSGNREDKHVASANGGAMTCPGMQAYLC